MKECIFCGDMTFGSTGAAGMFWPVICQTCKNREDKALLEKLKYQKRVIDLVMPEKAGDI